MSELYSHAGISIHHGDCRDILPTLGAFDLLLTDPPFGIDYESTFNPRGKITGDDGSLDLGFLFARGRHQCIFGANNFPHLLPFGGRWLCWDKRVVEAADRMKGSPFELAWTNRDHGFDWMIRLMHGGVVNDDGGKRFHPTQKPKRLWAEIIRRFRIIDPTIKRVIDPFVGSGGSLIAAKEAGLEAVGIEIEERYCHVAAQRLSQELLAI